MGSVAPTKAEIIDLFWRSTWTFIGAFTGGTVVTSIGGWDIDAVKLAAISGGGAVVTLLKSYASNKLGTGTAASKSPPAANLPEPVVSDLAAADTRGT